MARFEGARKTAPQEKALTFTFGEKLAEALSKKGVEVARANVDEDFEEDVSSVYEVGGDDAQTREVNKQAVEALQENVQFTEQALDAVAQQALSEAPDTGEVDEGWMSPEEMRKTFRVIEGGALETDTSEVDTGWDLEALPGTKGEESRQTLRGGFESGSAQGGKGLTEIVEQGPTGTLYGDKKEKESEAGVVEHGPDTANTSPEIETGEGYLTTLEMNDLGLQPEPEPLSLREAVEEAANDNDKRISQEEPLSLRELLEREEEQWPVKTTPAVTPEGGVDLVEEAEREDDRKAREEEIMRLLSGFETSRQMDQEVLAEAAQRFNRLGEQYREEFGDEEFVKLQKRFGDKLDELFESGQKEPQPAVAEITPESPEAVSLRGAQEEGGTPWVERAAVMAGAAAATKAVEGGPKTIEMSTAEQAKNEIAGTPVGAWHENFAKGKFGQEHWNALTDAEKQNYRELELQIMDQQERLKRLKEGKDAMERTLRSQWGNQFEVNARAQKMLREKAGEIAKVEALLNRSKREQEMIREAAIERLEPAVMSESLREIKEKQASDKAWELEEFPAKSSWWKKHPKMRKVAIGGGIAAGAGLFAGAWLGFQVMKRVMRPLKALELLGSASEKLFNFLDRALVKGDPVGAVQDSAKGAEKFFGEKFANLEKWVEEKTKGKGGKDKGIKYSNT